MINISSDNIYKMINDGKDMNNFAVNEPIVFSKIQSDNFKLCVKFTDCKINKVDMGFLVCEELIQFENCFIESIFAMSTFSHGGLILNRCIINGISDFSAGGHNKKDRPFEITNCIFKEYVTFCDDWFENKVIIMNNTFDEETDLLQKSDKPTIVRFDSMECIIKDNVGELGKCI